MKSFRSKIQFIISGFILLTPIAFAQTDTGSATDLSGPVLNSSAIYNSSLNTFSNGTNFYQDQNGNIQYQAPTFGGSVSALHESGAISLAPFAKSMGSGMFNGGADSFDYLNADYSSVEAILNRSTINGMRTDFGFNPTICPEFQFGTVRTCTSNFGQIRPTTFVNGSFIYQPSAFLYTLDKDKFVDVSVSDVLSDDEYRCETQVDENSLTQLMSQFQWPSCYAKRTKARGSEKNKLIAEIDTCNCLRSTQNESLNNIMNQSLLNNSQIRQNANVALNLDQQVHTVQQGESDSVLNGLLFNASILGMELVDDKAAGDLVYNYGSMVYQNFSYQPNESLYQEKFPLPEGQCIPFREFQQMRMLPETDEEYEALAQVVTKSPLDIESLNYKTLESKYRDIMKLSLAERNTDQNKARILTLKTSLKFLNRNPMVKLLLSSSEANAAQKGRLFSSLRLLGDVSCKNYMSPCARAYRQSQTQIFADPTITNLVKKESRDNIKRRADQRIQKGDLLSNMTGDISRERVIQDFVRNYNLKNPNSCQEGDTSMECLQTFSAYCKTIDSVKPKIEAMKEGSEDSLLIDNLDEELRDDFNADLATNEAFRKVNQDICQMPRHSGLLTKRKNFREFVQEYCQKNSGDEDCRLDNAEKYANLRRKFYDANPNGGRGAPDRVNENLVNGNTLKNISLNKSEFAQMSGPRTLSSENLSFRSPSPIENFYPEQPSSQQPKGADYSSAAVAGSTSTENSRSDNSQSQQSNYVDYSTALANMSGSSQTRSSNGEQGPTKIENLSDPKRDELLSDWEKEYNQWKANKGNDLSPADQVADQTQRNEIATMRALLEQEKRLREQEREISDQQQQMLQQKYDQLNAAIERRESENQRARTARTQSSSDESSPFTSGAAVPGDVVRAPASVKDSQLSNASNAAAGFASSAGTSGIGSGAQTSGASGDVDREQSKLVNYRSGDGLIVESAGSGVLAPNAISVPVSEDQYRILQSNPSQFNLGQLQGKIPQDQIRSLGNGEFILLLKNGANPPFEVKVQMVKNKLVYSQESGTTAPPVRRVSTLSSLQQISQEAVR